MLPSHEIGGEGSLTQIPIDGLTLENPGPFALEIWPKNTTKFPAEETTHFLM